MRPKRETRNPQTGGVRGTPDGLKRLSDHDWLFALKHNLYASAALAHCADMNPRLLSGPIFKLPAVLKLTYTNPFALSLSPVHCADMNSKLFDLYDSRA